MHEINIAIISLSYREKNKKLKIVAFSIDIGYG